MSECSKNNTTERTGGGVLEHSFALELQATCHLPLVSREAEHRFFFHAFRGLCLPRAHVFFSTALLCPLFVPMFRKKHLHKHLLSIDSSATSTILLGLIVQQQSIPTSASKKLVFSAALGSPSQRTPLPVPQLHEVCKYDMHVPWKMVDY